MVKVLLVRHLPVSVRWSRRCYGRSDAGLDRAAMLGCEALVRSLRAFEPDLIVSSPLRRARWLAGHVARNSATLLTIDTRLRELDFGTWEGRRWDDIWRETGAAMNGLIDDPSTFRPGGGETTFDVRDRAMAVMPELAGRRRVLVVCHGGPIAAIRGTLGDMPVRDWPSLVPRTGEGVEIDL